MENSLQVEKLLGTASPDTAGQVFSARISFGDGAVGTIVSCILVSGSKKDDAQTLARDIYEIAIKKLESASGSVLGALTEARESGLNIISSKAIDVGFAHLVFYRQAVYVVRYQDLVRVLLFGGEKPFEIKFENGSGPVKVGQIYVVATEKFIKDFKPGDLITNKVNLEETVDGLATEISAQENSAEIAAAFVQVKESSLESDAKVESDGVAHDEKGEHMESEGQNVNDANAKGQSESKISDDERQEQDVRGVNPVDAVRPVPGRKVNISTFLKGLFGGFAQEVKQLRSGEIGAVLRLRRNAIIVAAILVIVLALSAGLSIKHKGDRQNDAQFNEFLLDASSKYSESEGLVELNKDRARQILVEAGSEVDKALSIKADDARALDLKQKIAAKLKQTDEVATVSFKDFARVDGILVGLGIVNKNLIGISQNKIYIVDADSKTLDNFSGADGANSAYIFDNNVFELAGKEVYKADLSSKKSEKIIDGELSSDICVFIGNIYLLGQTQIYKYTPIDKGYAKSGDYLEVPQSFGVDSRMAIDGNVWVTNGADIFKFLRGSREDFAISGLVSGEHKFGKIYTTGDLDNLYVVDIVNKALLVISKDGNYKRAYQGDEFAKAGGIVVDEVAGKIYLAVENKILEADL